MSTLDPGNGRRDAKGVRCAIYTRKSSEEGLEQDFNSLDAQREACEAYIPSQKHEGWTVIATLCLPFIPSAAETLEFPLTAGYLRRHTVRQSKSSSPSSARPFCGV